MRRDHLDAISAQFGGLSFGAQVAEEETSDLADYFVETDQWLRIFGGEVDVIRGPKGAGKSAIYLLLSTRADELFDKRIMLISAEKPRGTPSFLIKVVVMAHESVTSDENSDQAGRLDRTARLIHSLCCARTSASSPYQ
jgi:hypothetical protein